MTTSKEVIVLTTSSAGDIHIKQFLKPVSAHLVAGTNLFNDFLGGLTDVFGGRSNTYQKQLTSLYNEAIDNIKNAAYEIGANCVLGLSIDLDEISGKGKSMFMLTAIGTAVIIDKQQAAIAGASQSPDSIENISADRITILSKRRSILDHAAANTLTLNDEVWEFISSNQVDEVFPFLLNKYAATIVNEQYHPELGATFYKQLISYLHALSHEKQASLLYNAIEGTNNEKLSLKLCGIVKKLQLFDHNKVMDMLRSDDLQIRKRGLLLSTCDKPFYNKQDQEELQQLVELINNSFPNRGTMSTKKGLLSSKEKEVWVCECGRTNDIGIIYCSGCSKDIKGFREKELDPADASSRLSFKISLICEGLG